MRAAIALCCTLFLGAFPAVYAEVNPRFYAVEASAAVQTSPAAITLSWSADPAASKYTISRKSLASSSWSQIGTTAGNATSFTDTSVSVGQAYEYRLVKNTGSYTGHGYIYAGINLPLVENRGKVLLLVDNTHAAYLAPELARLQADLVGDGWTVIRRDVARSMTPPQVKAIIQNEWNADRANMRSVFIFGHVAVPYSGNFAVDGHGDHQGAWPADTYYADMDGSWSDSSAYSSGASKPANQNAPGDGKFDQNNIPSDVELEVGRVDLFNMTCFANKSFSRDEKYLLRQYLNKDHNFRHRKFTVARKGVVADNWGERGGEAFAASGWRNFAPMFGASASAQLGWGDYFPHLKNNEALFSWGGGGGGWTTANGIGGSDDFALNDPKTVFTMFLGSYFGDWDNESAFLRAPLGTTTYTLASAWAGRPHWVFHHMGLGETLGLGAKLTMNNGSGGPYANSMGARGVHIALMGDPTLRLHPVIPPSSLSGAATGVGVTLAWGPSTDTDVVGYHVYRAGSLNGPFTRLTSSPIAAATYTDVGGSGTYMVRAVKLERSGSGSYFNSSQGIFWPNTTSFPEQEPAPAAPSGLTATAVSASQINLSWSDNASNETGYVVERRTGSGAYAVVATLGANSRSHTDSGAAPGTQYFYRVGARNSAGQSLSGEATATTQPGVVTEAAATFIKTDLVTSGNWSASYGVDGYLIPGHRTSLPGYASVSQSGASDYLWSGNTTDTRALERVDNGRIASCWYSSGSYTVDVNLNDGAAHRVSLYVMDWDRSGRSQTIEVLSASGAVLDTRTVSAFESGKYLVWDVQGNVKFRLTRTAGYNAVIMGMFFDAAEVSDGGVGNAAAGLASGKFHLRVKGEVGQRFKIYSSTNLTTWTEISTVTLSGTTHDFVDEGIASVKTRFYRATLVD